MVQLQSTMYGVEVAHPLLIVCKYSCVKFNMQTAKLLHRHFQLILEINKRNWNFSSSRARNSKILKINKKFCNANVQSKTLIVSRQPLSSLVSSRQLKQIYIVHFRPFSPILVHFRQLSLAVASSRPRSSTLVNSCQLSSLLVSFRLLSSIFVSFRQHLSTLFNSRQLSATLVSSCQPSSTVVNPPQLSSLLVNPC